MSRRVRGSQTEMPVALNCHCLFNLCVPFAYTDRVWWITSLLTRVAGVRTSLDSSRAEFHPALNEELPSYLIS